MDAEQEEILRTGKPGRGVALPMPPIKKADKSQDGVPVHVFDPVIVIGQTEEHAAANLKLHHGFTMRIVESDGERFIMTCEYRADRVNVVTKNGIVTEVYSIG